MEDFYECLLLKHGIAWVVGAGIFLLTILLVARRNIGFFLSMILILIALGASMAIEHQGHTIAYWNKFLPESLKIHEEPKPTEAVLKSPTTAPSNQQRSNPQQNLDNTINIRGQAEQQKQRVNTFTPP